MKTTTIPKAVQRARAEATEIRTAPCGCRELLATLQGGQTRSTIELHHGAPDGHLPKFGPAKRTKTSRHGTTRTTSTATTSAPAQPDRFATAEIRHQRPPFGVHNLEDVNAAIGRLAARGAGRFFDANEQAEWRRLVTLRDVFSGGPASTSAYSEMSVGPNQRREPRLPTSIAEVERQIRHLTTPGLRRNPREQHMLELLRDQAAFLKRAEERKTAARRVLDREREQARHQPRKVPATVDDLRSKALHRIDQRGKHLSAAQLDHLDDLLRSDDQQAVLRLARRIELTESDVYRAAWRKLMTETVPAFLPDESAALLEYQETRARTEGTGSAGGYGVPVTIDPTIILSSGASEAPVLTMSRVVSISGPVYKVPSTPGASFGFKSEGWGVIGRDGALGQTEIDIQMANGWLPFSQELGQDYPDWATIAADLLSQAYIDLMAQQTVVGTSPIGIFTALTNVTTNPAHITVTTAGTLGAVDIRKAWDSLPQRFRGRASWLMSPTVEAQIKGLDGTGAQVDYETRLTDAGVTVTSLMGKPVVVSDYAPSFTGTTGAENFAVVGDFSGFTVAVRQGFETELVRQLFDQATMRPTLASGWLATARIGTGLVAPNAFRLLANS